MEAGEFARVSNEDLRFSVLDGNGLDLDGVEPVVFENPVLGQDEPVGPFALGYAEGDRLTGALEKEFVVARGKTAKVEVASLDRSRRGVISLIEALALGKE